MEHPGTNKPEESVQNSANEVSADCLRVSVILRQILQHFSNRELLQLSIVKKIWNFEARSLMRDRGTTITHLPSPHPYDGLQGFASALQRMQVVPFSGIRIEMRYNHWSRQSSDGVLDPTHKVILEQFQWKYLSVKLFANWTQYKKCQAYLLAKRILQDFSGDLEEICLSIDSDKQEFFREVVQDSSFPRLKILTVYGAGGSDEAFTNYMKAYISRAPILQVLNTGGSRLHLMENIMQGSSAVVLLDDHGFISSEDFPEGALGILRMKRIKLEIPGREFDVRRFNRITPMVLQTSYATLRSLYIDIALAVPLMSFGIRLENVKSFQMEMNYGRRELTSILRIVKHFDFARILPKLNKVFIDDRLESRNDLNDLIHEIIEDGNALFIENLPDRAINIKELYIEDSVRDYAIEFFANMFPNLEKLTVEDDKTGLEISYGQIWEHWTNLKELELEIGGTQMNENLDGVFCGIFPEEVADLREKDDEYLMNVHVVPVMPSLTCLRDLKTLRVIYNYHKNAGGSSSAPLVFSKVTGLIAFKRYPTLAVNLETYDSEDIEALSHMKPYASVVIDYS